MWNFRPPTDSLPAWQKILVRDRMAPETRVAGPEIKRKLPGWKMKVLVGRLSRNLPSVKCHFLPIVNTNTIVEFSPGRFWCLLFHCWWKDFESYTNLQKKISRYPILFSCWSTGKRKINFLPFISPFFRFVVALCAELSRIKHEKATWSWSLG